MLLCKNYRVVRSIFPGADALPTQSNCDMLVDDMTLMLAQELVKTIPAFKKIKVPAYKDHKYKDIMKNASYLVI